MTTFATRTHFCPIESALHPEVELLEGRAIAWLDRVGLPDGPRSRARLIGTNGAEFYARIVPRAPVERVQPAVHWVYWGFAYDDDYSDGSSGPGSTMLLVDRSARLLRILESGDRHRPHDEAYLIAIADIADDFARRCTPTQLRRWTTAHRGWLAACAWETAQSEAGVAPSVSDYLAMRLNSCGGEPTTAMIEMSVGAEVPAAEMDSPLVVALTEAARMVAALDNDLVSYRRESRLGRSGLNLIDVVARAERCTTTEAAVRATAIRDRVMALFLRLRERLPRSASPELREYARCLGHTIRGNLEWSLRVPRYHSETEEPGTVDPVEGPRWSERPSDPDPSPLPVPSLSWWWDQL